MNLCDKYLIQDYPLFVYPHLAVAIGLNKAIVLNKVHYWITREENKKFHDGRFWTFNPVKKWQIQFPFWGIRTIQQIFLDMEREGILLVGRFNKLKIDKTKWHTIDYNRLEEVLTIAEKRNPFGKLCASIRQETAYHSADIAEPLPLNSSLNSSLISVTQATETVAGETTPERLAVNALYEIRRRNGTHVMPKGQRVAFFKHGADYMREVLKIDTLDQVCALFEWADRAKFWSGIALTPQHYNSIKAKYLETTKRDSVDMDEINRIIEGLDGR